MKNPFSRQPRNTDQPASSGVSLQTKMLALFLALSLVPGIVVTLVSVNQTRIALTNAAEFSLHAGASQIAAALDATINSNLDSIRTEANQNIFVSFLKLPRSERSSSDLKDAVRYELTTLSLKEPTYVLSYALVDLNGRVLADTVDANVGKSEQANDYFGNVVDRQVPYVTPVVYNKNGILVVYFAAPVRDEAGAIVGILRSEYRVAMLQELISKSIQESGQDIRVTVFDEYNIRIVDSRDPELVQKTLAPMNPDLFQTAVAERRLLEGTPEEQSTNNIDYDQALNNSDTKPFFIIDTDSAKFAVAVAPVKSKPLKVAYSQPEALFLSDVQKRTTGTLLTMLGLAVLVVVISVLSSRQITNPIRELSSVAAVVTGGDLNVRAQVNRKDEIGALAVAFNLMTGRLQEILADLEKRVAERTQALTTVAEVSTAASTILETDRLLQEVVDLAKERFSFYHAHIYLLNEAGDTLVLASGAGEVGRQMVAEGRSIPLNREQSLVARAAREKKGVTVNDVTQTPDFLPNPLLPDTHSEMAVPMMVGEQLIGVFDLQSKAVGRFTDADIAVQTTLASQIAAAIQNARSFTKVKEAEQLTRTIIDATSDAIFIKDRKHRYMLVNEAYASSLHVPASELVGKDDLELGFPEEFVKGNPEKGLRGFWTDDDLVFETGQTQHYPSDPVNIDGAVHILDTLKIPLRNSEGDIWGMLGFSRDVTEREHLHELTAQRAREQETINTIAQKIDGAPTVEAALQIAARELGHAMGKRQTFVRLGPFHSDGNMAAIGSESQGTRSDVGIRKNGSH